jgi:hypothetical protein
VLTSEEALKTEHDSAMEVHHVKAALDVAVKEEVEPFAESSLQQKLDYVAGMMDSFVEQIAAKVKENDAMRAELTLMEKKSNHMQKTIEGERSASTGLERKLEMLKKELSGMEKKFEIAVLDKRRARSHVTDSKKECEDLARQLVSKDKTLIAKEKENARLLQSRDALATNCINLRAALRYMEKENTNLRKEVVDARFISHHLEGEVERLRKDVLGMQNGLPCAVVNGNVRSSAVEVQGLSSIQPTVLSLPQNCDISVQIETMRGELACLRHENVCSNEDAFTFFHATLLCWNSFCFEHSFSWKRCVVFLSQCSCSRQRRNMLLKVLWSLCWTEGAERLHAQMPNGTGCKKSSAW